MSDLNELLADIGDRARTYDVTERALTLGRRRRNARRLAGVGGLAAVVALSILGVTFLPAVQSAPLPPAAPSSPVPALSPTTPAVNVAACVAERLPMPRGYPPKSVVTGGDPTGRLLVGRAYPYDGRDRLLIWEDGKVKVIRHEGEDPSFRDISSTGIAVGFSFVDGDVQVPWIYRDGSLNRLKGRHAGATAVNDSGVTVGAMSEGGGSDAWPVIWRTSTAAPAALAMPAGMRGKATGIDADGTVSGWLQPLPSSPKPGQDPVVPVMPTRPVVWLPDGTMRDLKVPDSIDGNPVTGATAEDIHDGQVGGTLATGTTRADGRDFVARWNLATGEVSWHAVAGRPRLVNTVGLAVSWDRHPMLFLEQASVPLPDVQGAPESFEAEPDIRVISTDGRIVAGYQSIDKTGVVAVAWHCT
ncbi:hypothetical protein [Catellatospora citrea]|uniref:Uncharacterized protein n=1 Tax=Catellatospora citrea TaxID=53366 RepID=A0A8J3NWU0_9ACTN|nr:hypothetical protein [Catellatospora citrea]RKE07346.1 hypothetical protein C8E86_2172 [Catellatospora citrea]GIF95502.1 hypothetical protein Cci01nite_05960 [Catellatospora citrea]